MKSFLFLSLKNSFCTDHKEADGFFAFHEESVEAFNLISKETAAKIVLLDDDLNFDITQSYNPFVGMCILRGLADKDAVVGRILANNDIIQTTHTDLENPKPPIGFCIDHWKLNFLEKPYKADPQLSQKYEIWDKEGEDYQFVGMRSNQKDKDFKIAIFSTCKDTFPDFLYRHHETDYIAGNGLYLGMEDAKKIIKHLKNGL
jgi:hypothetical protein